MSTIAQTHRTVSLDYSGEKRTFPVNTAFSNTDAVGIVRDMFSEQPKLNNPPLKWFLINPTEYKILHLLSQRQGSDVVAGDKALVVLGFALHRRTEYLKNTATLEEINIPRPTRYLMAYLLGGAEGVKVNSVESKYREGEWPSNIAQIEGLFDTSKKIAPEAKAALVNGFMQALIAAETEVPAKSGKIFVPGFNIRDQALAEHCLEDLERVCKPYLEESSGYSPQAAAFLAQRLMKGTTQTEELKAIKFNAKVAEQKQIVEELLKYYPAETPICGTHKVTLAGTIHNPSGLNKLLGAPVTKGTCTLGELFTLIEQNKVFIKGLSISKAPNLPKSPIKQDRLVIHTGTQADTVPTNILNDIKAQLSSDQFLAIAKATDNGKKHTRIYVAASEKNFDTLEYLEETHGLKKKLGANEGLQLYGEHLLGSPAPKTISELIDRVAAKGDDVIISVEGKWITIESSDQGQVLASLKTFPTTAKQ